MADLPDWLSAFQGISVEATSFTYGLDAARPPVPAVSQIYLATDTKILYICVATGVWTGFDAAILVQGVLTLYANMVAGGYKITGLGDPTSAQDAATRAYVLAQVANYLLLAGGTMAGAIAMGGNKVTGLGAPTAQNDALRKGQAEIVNADIAAGAAVAYAKLDLALGVKNADIATTAAIALSKLASLPAVSGSGSYTGDATANKAIAHGLGVIPKIVLIISASDTPTQFRIHIGVAKIHWQASTTGDSLAVTAPDATNFYVGNATSYSNSANANGLIYYWVAMG